MMTAIFATMLASLFLGWFVNRCAAIACLGACLALTVWLFLYTRAATGRPVAAM